MVSLDLLPWGSLEETVHSERNFHLISCSRCFLRASSLLRCETDAWERELAPLQRDFWSSAHCSDKSCLGFLCISVLLPRLAALIVRMTFALRYQRTVKKRLLAMSALLGVRTRICLTRMRLSLKRSSTVWSSRCAEPFLCLMIRRRRTMMGFN